MIVKYSSVKYFTLNHWDWSIRQLQDHFKAKFIANMGYIIHYQVYIYKEKGNKSLCRKDVNSLYNQP